MTATYLIRVHRHLEQRWSQWFGGLMLSHDSDGGTSLEGSVHDQAALYGSIVKVRDRGLVLLPVERIALRSITSDDAADVEAQK